MQQWMRDRDLLVRECLAFAQRVAAARTVGVETPPAARTVRVETPQAEPPRSVELAQPKDSHFERQEIMRRMAEFKATQDRFEREREEYFKNVMAKVQAN
jgi:hypothetical protein